MTTPKILKQPNNPTKLTVIKEAIDTKRNEIGPKLKPYLIFTFTVKIGVYPTLRGNDGQKNLRKYCSQKPPYVKHNQTPPTLSQN